MNRRTSHDYLNRCQIDTPVWLAEETWRIAKERRAEFSHAVDLGAGDGIFAKTGTFRNYTGYEIDSSRIPEQFDVDNAEIINSCAFSSPLTSFDLAIGNPPFVRNQELPDGWRKEKQEQLFQETEVSLSGFANAYQYFILKSLHCADDDGLCVQIIPYEWISRPSAQALRNYIRSKGWSVQIYRMKGLVFPSYDTSATITVIDKRERDGLWQYFTEIERGKYREQAFSHGGCLQPISFVSPPEKGSALPFARRGLSPGSRSVFVLTEEERISNNLEIERDVLPCITTLRHLPEKVYNITPKVFHDRYVNEDKKCWLLNTERSPSSSLARYLAEVPEADRMSTTCRRRKTWWKYITPDAPKVLIATGFRSRRPKIAKNTARAIAVGSVAGMYNISNRQTNRIVKSLSALDLHSRVIEHSKGMRKLEIRQINSLMLDILSIEV